MTDERSRGSLGSAVIVLLLLGAGLATPWFSFDQSSGRQTAPEGPYAGIDSVERSNLDFYAFQMRGDAVPTDEAVAQFSIFFIGGLIGLATLLVLLAALGDFAFAERILPRTICLIFYGVAFGAVAGALVYTWFVVPATMSGYGVDRPFTFFLQEPEGYTQTTLGIGWVAGAVSLAMIISAWLWKFQAGSYDPKIIEAYRAV